MITRQLSPGSFARFSGQMSLSLCLVLAALLAGSGCNPPTKGQGPGHRSQVLGLSPEQEYSLGVQAYREVLDKARAKGDLVDPDDPTVRRVRRVGERIARAAENEPLQREINLHLKGYRFDWEFNVIRDRQINAFCLPGGKVAVYSGLLPIVENDDQLATVLSHEIAHALAHHSNERLTRQAMHEKAVEAANGALGRMNPTERQILIGVLSGGASVRELAYDRQQESEADHIGLFLMTFAGYDPDEAVEFWERMRQASHGGRPPEILSTHPSDVQRIQQMRAWLPQVKAAKVAYDQHRIAPSR
jgi:predicted Zn-dependent protease